MLLEDLLGTVSIDGGFYIRSKGYNTYYTCADDFYESPETRYNYERPVQLIEIFNNKLCIILGD